MWSSSMQRALCEQQGCTKVPDHSKCRVFSRVETGKTCVRRKLFSPLAWERRKRAQAKAQKGAWLTVIPSGVGTQNCPVLQLSYHEHLSYSCIYYPVSGLALLINFSWWAFFSIECHILCFKSIHSPKMNNSEWAFVDYSLLCPAFTGPQNNEANWCGRKWASPMHIKSQYIIVYIMCATSTNSSFPWDFLGNTKKTFLVESCLVYFSDWFIKWWEVECWLVNRKIAASRKRLTLPIRHKKGGHW